MLLSQFCFYHHIVFYESLFLYPEILWQEVMRDYRKFYSEAARDTSNYSSFSSLFKSIVTQGKICGTTIYIAFHKDHSILVNKKGLGEGCVLPSPSRIMVFLSCLSETNLINILSFLHGRLIFILKIISLQAIMSFVSGMRARNRLTKPREMSFCGKFMRYECFPLPWLTAMLLSINMHSVSVPIFLWHDVGLWFQMKMQWI